MEVGHSPKPEVGQSPKPEVGHSPKPEVGHSPKPFRTLRNIKLRRRKVKDVCSKLLRKCRQSSSRSVEYGSVPLASDTLP